MNFQTVIIIYNNDCVGIKLVLNVARSLFKRIDGLKEV